MTESDGETTDYNTKLNPENETHDPHMRLPTVRVNDTNSSVGDLILASRTKTAMYLHLDKTPPWERLPYELRE
jgi:hypothetical protein